MIKITQKWEKWIIQIDGEEWEADGLDEFKKMFEKIIDLKVKHGQIR